MKLKLAFSPCPNDTFIFEHFIHNKASDFEVELHTYDIAALNKEAALGKMDVLKLSFFAYFQNSHLYDVLSSGSALGFACGPLLISKSGQTPNSNDLIAIPGENTTANFLLQLAYPELKHKKTMLFSAIEKAILSSQVEAGLLIHENRFTYKDLGLKKIQDLGEFWERKTGLPIPLGCIAVRKSLPMEVKQKIDAELKNSIQKAHLAKEISPFIKKHAQSMDNRVIKQHIDTYVNEYTYNLGVLGEKAINTMRQCALDMGIKMPSKELTFVK